MYSHQSPGSWGTDGTAEKRYKLMKRPTKKIFRTYEKFPWSGPCPWANQPGTTGLIVYIQFISS